MSPTDAYLQTLRRELAFDPQLAERVSREVEDHFDEMIGDQGGDDACRRAIQCMGDPRALAASMAQATLPQRVKSTWHTLALAALAVFLAMRLRSMFAPPVDAETVWYVLARFIDIGAFLMALGAASYGFFLAAGWKADAAGQTLSIHLMRATVAMLTASGLAGASILAASNAISAGHVAALPLTAAILEWTALLLAVGAMRRTALQNRLSLTGNV